MLTATGASALPFQPGSHLGKRFGSMTNTILLFNRQLGKRFSILRNQKYRIVPKPSISDGVFRDDTLETPLSDVDIATGKGNRGHRQKPCVPCLLRDPLKLA